jgi:hypothetical protein
MQTARIFRVSLHSACLMFAIASLAVIAVFAVGIASADQSDPANASVSAAQSAADAAARCDASAFRMAAADYAAARPFTPVDEQTQADELFSQAAATFAGCQPPGSLGATSHGQTVTTTTQVTRTTQTGGQSTSYNSSVSTPAAQSPVPAALPAVVATPNPSVWLDSAAAVSGAIVSLSGSGFTPGSIVRICWNSSADPCQDVAGTGSIGLSVDGNGGFTIQFAVPADAPGDHLITVEDTLGLQATTSLWVMDAGGK